jgi:Holliday junction resolvase RusA-like endonuclease
MQMPELEKSKINRVKESFGVCHINLPQMMTPQMMKPRNDLEYEIDYTRKFYLFDVIPFGAVRMTQSDKWKTNPNHLDPRKRQREAVTKYFHFKDQIRQQAQEMKFNLSEILEIVFLVPMPFTWSEKKKVRSNKTPVKTRPDIDNYVKGFMDALENEDGFVWKIVAEKRYAFKGSILVYETNLI